MNTPRITPPGSTRIGEHLIAAGLLSREQVDEIIVLQQRENLRFGVAAVKLGYLKESEVQRILADQFGYATALADEHDDIAPRLAIMHAPFSQEAEAIRQIRANLASRQDDDGNLCVAIVSPAEGEGKTYLASSLAVAFAQTGQSTLLINANLRASGQPEPLRQKSATRSEFGLSTVLSGRSNELPLRAVPGFPQLSVLEAGPIPPNPLEILADPALARLLGEFKRRFHIIILDTPAAMASSDAQVIARQTRFAVLVGRRDHTRLNPLQQVHQLLLSNGVTLLGTVYNTFPVAQRSSRVQGWGRLTAWLRRKPAAGR